MSVDYREFYLVGDDYGGVTVVCRTCQRKTRSLTVTAPVKIGYEDMPDVATIINIVQEHVHDKKG